ncbi:proline-rich protein [Hygrophoropsis aurantiaca]|uniref:Proline-rich protein n=1 Tax=Hygrophoropsis aurantiaca TaxID=72124 RepID=A0ACB8AAB8_9AGAM|nr:proline-rich protein [Hygrophoropsis aurantiaca]
MLGLDDYGSDDDDVPKKHKRPPKRIAVEKPEPVSRDEPPAKKARTKPAGSSALFSLLPPPKPVTAPAPPTPQRVLGGGQRPGLVFTEVTPVTKARDEPAPAPVPSASTSSAPPVPEFTPPEPRPDDPYPGYYLLPSGTWAAHDPTYYLAFHKKWQREYDTHLRALEAHADTDANPDTQNVDVAQALAEGVKQREETKAITKTNGEPAQPRMNVKGAKLGATARSRHQLTTLLSEAYSNREALEERIAQGRRNRKEAGNKYGF